MKKKLILKMMVCMSFAFLIAGCGKAETVDEAPRANATEESKTQKVSVTTDVSEDTEEKTVISDRELFEAFLKNNAEVHFTNYQPEKYYEINGYMFDKDDSVTLNDLLATYDRYYLEELSYTEIIKNISYTYIDAGDAGKQQLVVECSFPQGSGAQFIIEAVDGQLEMMYVIDSVERIYGTVANKYGLITRTGTSSYAEYSVENLYLDENGEMHKIYNESANYLFGKDDRYADPLLSWALDFREKEGFKSDVILRTYSFDEFESDFTPEEEEAYYNNMLYTVEYVTDEEPWHEDEMYEEGSIFRRIFEKANRPLSTPEEIEAAIAKKERELKMPQKAMEEDPVILTDFSNQELGAVLGADVTDGRSELEHALTAYAKFLKNPVNMCEILTEQTHSPYGDAQPGMVYGFALRDFTEDDIPELVIDFGQPGFAMMQKIYIYSYNDSDGLVRRMFKMPDGMLGDYGLKYLRKEMNESYMTWYNEDLEKKIAECPDYADALLNVKYEGPRMVGTYGRYLVAFDEGVEEDMYKSVTWYDFVEDDAQSYTETLAFIEGDGGTYLDYTTDESCQDEPEEIVNNFKPILFYEIDDANIEEIVSEDYWKANCGEDGFSDYSAEDAYNFLSQKARWYYDLGIMDDDDSYDSISCYDYDEDTNISTTIYFDLDKRLQSHFRIAR